MRTSGLIIAGASAAYFLLAVMVVVPLFREGDVYSKVYLFEGLGDSPGAIVRTLLTDPGVWIERLTQWRIAGFALFLVIPVACLPLGTRFVIAALPVFVFIGLMTETSYTSIRLWHQAIMIPVVWIAAIIVIARTDKRDQKRRLAAVAIATVLCHYAIGFSPASRGWQRLPLDPGDRPVIIETLRNHIDPADSVRVSPRLGAHFVEQARLFPWHADAGDRAHWILFDLNDRFAGPEAARAMQTQLRQELDSRRYRVVFQQSQVWLLRRLGEDQADSIPNSSPQDTGPQHSPSQP